MKQQLIDWAKRLICKGSSFQQVDWEMGYSTRCSASVETVKWAYRQALIQLFYDPSTWKYLPVWWLIYQTIADHFNECRQLDLFDENPKWELCLLPKGWLKNESV